MCLLHKTHKVKHEIEGFDRKMFVRVCNTSLSNSDGADRVYMFKGAWWLVAARTDEK